MSAQVTDKSLERLISLTLRGGVLAATTLGLLGGALALITAHPQPAEFHHFIGEASLFASPASTVRLLFSTSAKLADRGQALAQLGIIVLLLTPIIRVLFSIIGFALERDRIYVVITCIVLATLTVSLILH
ncbi:DUF1634 domain-containing protein [Granulicella cerasi]|uniref:DUF1634 domain-containing protein n=1 Tax=Granulicella cerasi TaxID=741063 RepID=A0ABW1Z4Y1_9BACT|nr:DUF1634 domain-containing protein [Granulicella cerasi]